MRGNSVGVGEDAEYDLSDQTQRRRDVKGMQQVFQSFGQTDSALDVGADEESEWKVDRGHPLLRSRLPVVIVVRVGKEAGQSVQTFLASSRLWETGLQGGQGMDITGHHCRL